MKIKVIDLYYKTIKNEEVPKVIKYDNTIWEYDKDNNDYYSDEWLFSSYLGNSTLNEFCNDEAKIIEEKKIELPEKIDEWKFNRSESDIPHFELAQKLNQIIDYLKYKEEEKEK